MAEKAAEGRAGSKAVPAAHGGALGAQFGCPDWVAEGGHSVVALLGGRGHQTMGRSPPRSPKADEDQLEGWMPAAFSSALPVPDAAGAGSGFLLNKIPHELCLCPEKCKISTSE